MFKLLCKLVVKVFLETLILKHRQRIRCLIFNDGYRIIKGDIYKPVVFMIMAPQRKRIACHCWNAGQTPNSANKVGEDGEGRLAVNEQSNCIYI